MYNGVGKAIDAAFNFIKYILLPLAFLGLWKLVEIVAWVIKHLSLQIV